MTRGGGGDWREQVWEVGGVGQGEVVEREEVGGGGEGGEVNSAISAPCI